MLIFSVFQINMTETCNDCSYNLCTSCHDDVFHSCSGESNIVFSEDILFRLPVEVSLHVLYELDVITLISYLNSRKSAYYTFSNFFNFKKLYSELFPISWNDEPDHDWFKVLSKVILTQNCMKCLYADSYKFEKASVLGTNRLWKESQMFQGGNGIYFKIQDFGLGTKASCLIIGPENSPYENGHFYLTLSIPYDYPYEVPYVRMHSFCWHPNIDNYGNLVLPMFSYINYSPCFRVESVLLVIQNLLAEPDLQNPVNTVASETYTENFNAYYEIASGYTSIYAIQ